MKEGASLMNANKLMIGALIVQSAMIIGLWYGPSAQPARADIPDAAGQLVSINQRMSDTNTKLDKIIDLLQNGHLQVHVAKADDK
jgi:hypothetical protein